VGAYPFLEALVVHPLVVVVAFPFLEALEVQEVLEVLP
jgi:hypothetical protein